MSGWENVQMKNWISRDLSRKLSELQFEWKIQWVVLWVVKRVVIWVNHNLSGKSRKHQFYWKINWVTILSENRVWQIECVVIEWVTICLKNRVSGIMSKNLHEHQIKQMVIWVSHNLSNLRRKLIESSFVRKIECNKLNE